MTVPAETEGCGSGRRARPLLRAQALRKSYGATEAVAGVDFALAENSYVTLLGPSGCGKTSILRMIGGFEPVSSGALHLDGQRLDQVPAHRRTVNTVFQSYALFPHLSVLQNVAFGLRYRGVTGSKIDAQAREALKTVQMDAFAHRRPRQLSGGQQQRVALARALVNAPRLLLLDEPLSALDRRMRKDMQIELQDLQRRLGLSFLHVTHDQEEAFALSDRIIVMRAGRIEQQGDPGDIYARPQNAYVADFIGGAACVPARVIARDGDRLRIECALGQHLVPGVAELAPGDAAVLCLRPEQIRRTETGLSALVAHIVYRGSDWLVDCRCNGVALQLIHPGPPPAVGDTIGIGFDPDGVWAACAEGPVTP